MQIVQSSPICIRNFWLEICMICIYVFFIYWFRWLDGSRNFRILLPKQKRIQSKLTFNFRWYLEWTQFWSLIEYRNHRSFLSPQSPYTCSPQRASFQPVNLRLESQKPLASVNPSACMPTICESTACSSEDKIAMTFGSPKIVIQCPNYVKNWNKCTESCCCKKNLHFISVSVN